MQRTGLAGARRTRTRSLRSTVSLLATLVAVLASAVLATAAPETPRPLARLDGDKIDPALRAALAHAPRVDALLVLREQADLAPAELVTVRTARVALVHRTVRALATRTQQPLRALLERLGIAHRTFSVVNAIAVAGVDAAQLELLAARDDVAAIESDLPVRIAPPHPERPPADVAATDATAAIEWGVAHIGAPELWAQGFRGGGVVYANADTGVQWDHPALKRRYRGWGAKRGKAKHDYHWWDAIHSDLDGDGVNPCGFSSPAPCDDDGHGTHTLGTAVGDDRAGNQIGVAPRAKWIACRNMENGVGRVSTYLECFDFFLAPWDRNRQNPKPARAPHVIANSWTCTVGAPPAGEGCVPRSIRKAVNAARAAGIFVVAAAGNEGPGCATIADPPAIHNAATTVGATNQSDALAGFSSRGPVTVDGSGRRKPDLVAPGVGIRSSWPGNAYATLSGTSMAAPHVGGAVALLWSARPDLRGVVGRTERALLRSASPAVTASGECGGTTSADVPNALFGHGRLDVAAALAALR